MTPHKSTDASLHYKELVKMIHPDVNPNDDKANEKLQLLNSLYSTIQRENKIVTATIEVQLYETITGCERYLFLKDNKIKLDIPAGVKTSDEIYYSNIEKLRIDLVVRVHVVLPAHYAVVDGKLFYNVSIPFWRAKFDTVKIMNLPNRKEHKFKIPANSTNDSIYKIRNAGLYNKKLNNQDDLYIRIKISLT